MKRAVDEYLAHGFRAVKFGWGAFGRDLSLDAALVKAARQAAGPDVVLMVDGGWYGTSHEEPYRPRSLRDWIRLVGALEEQGVFWLEDFLHPDNFAGYARVAKHTKTLRIAASNSRASRSSSASRTKARRTCCSRTFRAAAGSASASRLPTSPHAARWTACPTPG